MIVTERYKYAVYHHGKNSEQFYDLQKDPGEMKNFLQAPEYGDILNEMKKLYQKEWPN